MNIKNYDDDFRPRNRAAADPDATAVIDPPIIATEAESEFAAAEADPRPNDDGSGHTRQVPLDLRPMNPEEVEAMSRRRLDEDWAAIEEEMTDGGGIFGWPKVLSSPIIGVCLLGIGAVLGLFIVNQISASIATLSQAPVVWQWAGGIALGLLGFAALYAFLRVGFLYYRLKRNEPVRLKLLRELEERKNLRRWMVQAQWQKAWGRIEIYLREYPLEPGKEQRALRAVGANEVLLGELTSKREQLLDRKRFMGEDKSLAQFQTTFQTKLDELAAKRIRYWANRTALTTAVSPNALADTLATMYCSFSMLGDLCAVYNLRTNRTGTAILLARIFLNAYLAGQLNEVEGIAGEGAAHLLSSNMPISEMLAQVIGKLSAKVGAGMVNYYLLNRLGSYACRLLRPVDAKR